MGINKVNLSQKTVAVKTAFPPIQVHSKFLTGNCWVLARFPVLRSSFIESGIEYERFRQLRNPTPPGALDNFSGTVATAQLTNFSDYQGYRLTTILGFELARKSFEFDEVETRTRGFVTIFAGVQ